MPSVPLSARTIAGLKSGDRADLCDALAPGLTLRVSASGVKTWSVLYKHRGRNRRLTIGRYPALSLADAREQARTVRARVALGEDPAGDKQTERATFDQTIANLVEDYEKHAGGRRSWPETNRILQNEILPSWRNRAVKDITRADVRQMIERKVETAPIMANRLLARVSRLFNFALEREWIEANPAARIRKPAEERSRDRVLEDDELRALWKALQETEAEDDDGNALNRLVPALNDAFQVMLLTAQRCGEVCRMRWEDLDLKAGWWSIPGAFTKNGADHRVPLSRPALDILKRREKTKKPDAVFVFVTRTKRSVAARAKKAASFLSVGLPFAFRAHDLRRTAASRMAAAGIPRDHIAHVLNHRSVTRATVTAIYDRYTYDVEKRTALETWARSLEAVTSGKRARSKVVSLATKRW
jgi:integrase